MSAPPRDAGGGLTLATARMYSGRIISVDRDTVRFPDGSEGELDLVRHPGASAVVAVLDDVDAADPTLVLLRQYRYAASGYLLEIPAGRLEPGEPPEACAARELEEETGYRAGALDHLFTMFTTPGFTDERIHVFLASALRPGETARERDEFMEVVTHPLSAVLRMIESGAIQDAKTALGVLVAGRVRLQRS